MNILLSKADFSDNNIGTVEIPVVKNVNLAYESVGSDSYVLPPNDTESLGKPIIVNTIGDTPNGQGIIHTLTFTKAVQTSAVPTHFLKLPFKSVIQKNYLGKIGFGCWIKYDRASGINVIATRYLGSSDMAAVAMAGGNATANDFNITTETSTNTTSSYLGGTVKTKVLATKVINGETWNYIAMLVDITSIAEGSVYDGKEIICGACFSAYSQVFNNSVTSSLNSISIKVANVTFGYFDDYPDPNTVYPFI